jgi:hypothetical protein
MKVTAQFKNDSGNVTVAVFDRDARTVKTQDGRSGVYTRAGPKQLVIEGDDNLTLTFDQEVQFERGFFTRYSGSRGAGVVTILAVE